ncbi:YgaP family membrane protein [Noviherbaspirillum galbum]|uniref:DUF2892 domain-containing protein n=1 Tax=Noviherbaspirillum galbum TaxID=2709383 RepID=A0A6B3SND9_9BURK|nr:DUF2892 domain-containing protein [Noviherbaspirillum galbum]NEX62334.1 DUF2892 domain-containing protein [Noviherbaspirillum galbum]
MKPNLGTLDKAVRVVLALVFFSLYFFAPGNLKWFALIGLIPLATAFASWCPLYWMLGISTCGMGAGKHAG